MNTLVIARNVQAVKINDREFRGEDRRRCHERVWPEMISRSAE
jgi:hypothetical protein